MSPRAGRRSSPLSRYTGPAARPAGFTLLEVLVATVLLATVIVGALAVFSAALRSAQVADFETAAAGLAGQVVAQLRADPELEFGSLEGDFGTDRPDYHWTAEVSPTDRPSLVSVRLEITRGAGNGPDQARFDTFILRPGAPAAGTAVP